MENKPSDHLPHHLAIRVFGTVQGVYFRQSTKEKAQELNLTGFARNQPDGSVYIEAEGHPEALEKLAAWCHTGPRRAHVTRVETEAGEPTGFPHFEIKR